MYTNETQHLPHETAIDYVLETLDENEVWTAELHLKSCRQCQELLAQFQAVSDDVLFAIPPIQPPQALRERLAKKSAPDNNSPRQAAVHSPVPVQVLYGLGLAVIFLLAVSIFLFNQVRSLQTQGENLAGYIKNGQALAGLVGSSSNPHIIPVTGSSTQGSLVVSDKANLGILFLRGLPALDPGHTFQAWLIQADGRALSAAVFQANPGSSAVDLLLNSDRPLTSYAEIRVTIEPAGGSPAPGSPPLVEIKY